jgi:hypothetical protein
MLPFFLFLLFNIALFLAYRKIFTLFTLLFTLPGDNRENKNREDNNRGYYFAVIPSRFLFRGYYFAVIPSRLLLRSYSFAVFVSRLLLRSYSFAAFVSRVLLRGYHRQWCLCLKLDFYEF